MDTVIGGVVVLSLILALMLLLAICEGLIWLGEWLLSFWGDPKHPVQDDKLNKL